jgi:hypothetical protein
MCVFLHAEPFPRNEIVFEHHGKEGLFFGQNAVCDVIYTLYHLLKPMKLFAR